MADDREVRDDVKDDHAPPDARPRDKAPPNGDRAPRDERSMQRSVDGGPVQKLGRRQRKHLQDMHRPLESWERYRALMDMVEELLDLVDLADHKARFALIIMGALNAFLFILASETDVVEAIPPGLRPVLSVFIVVYALAVVYFVIQAIESLRPRKAQPRVLARRENDLEDLPLGLRFHEDALRYTVDEYRNAWRDLRIGQLNSELAVQAHALHQINTAKYAALRRLYLGLQATAVMAALWLALGTFFVVTGKAAEAKERKKAQAAAEAQRFRRLGVKEPSGVAWHAQRGRLYVVGDEGSMAEVGPDGSRQRLFEVDPQTEDVAVHDPTGLLVLVNEGRSELEIFDPEAGRILARVKLDAAGILGEAPGEANQGFEGIAFRADPARPGGGLFYLAHQRRPALVASVAFDVARPPAQLGAEAVVDRWSFRDVEDLTAVHWSEDMGRLLVLADADDAVLIVGDDGKVRGELEVPGEQQEGLAVAGDGSLWIADDKDKSLLRVPGGLESLTERRHGRRSLLLL